MIQVLPEKADENADGGELIKCMLDQCSQESFISEHVVQALGPKKYKTKVQVRGVGDLHGGEVTAYVKLRIKVDDPAKPIETSIAKFKD